MYSIYALIDPRDNLAYYVGLSKNVQKRYAMHLLNRDGRNTEKDAWIEHLMENGIIPALKILERMETKEEAERREFYWIHEYLEVNSHLTNRAKVGKMKNTTSIGSLQVEAEINTNMEHVRTLFKSHGLTLHMHTRRKGLKYVYAAWRDGEKIKQVYFAPQIRVEQMTEEEVKKKLAALKKY